MLTRAYRYSAETAIRALLILLCFCGGAVSRWINVDVPVMLCVILFALITLYCNISFAVKYSPMIAGVVLAVIGTYIVEENQLWLIELRKYSHYNGSLPLFAGYYLCFVLSLELGDRYFDRRKNQIVKLRIYAETQSILQVFLDVFGIIFLCVTLIMTVRIASHPYFFVHMDRFAYKTAYIQGIWGKLSDYYLYFIPLLLMNWHRKRQRRITILTLATYVVYLFLQGEKYGGYLTLALFLLFYFVPELPKGARKKLLRIMILVILVFIIAGFTILLQYSLLYDTSALTHIYERIAQQGQLWWNIYGLRNYEEPQIKEISDELDAYSDKGSETPYYSIYKMMYLSAPEDVVTRKIATGATYTESTAASIYYYFGFFALPIFAVLMGIFFSWLAKQYLRAIYGGYLFESLIITRLIQMGRSFFAMSRFTWIFALDTIVTIAIWMVCVFIRKARRTRLCTPCPELIVDG